MPIVRGVEPEVWNGDNDGLQCLFRSCDFSRCLRVLGTDMQAAFYGSVPIHSPFFLEGTELPSTMVLAKPRQVSSPL